MSIKGRILAGLAALLLLGGVVGSQIVSAQTGRGQGTDPAAQESEQIEHAHEDEDDDGMEAEEENDPALLAEAALTAAEAEATASAAYPEATVRHTEVEREDGRLIFEVELDSGLEVVIDAMSGEILGTEQD